MGKIVCGTLPCDAKGVGTYLVYFIELASGTENNFELLYSLMIIIHDCVIRCSFCRLNYRSK